MTSARTGLGGLNYYHNVPLQCYITIRDTMWFDFNTTIFSYFVISYL